MSGAKARHMRPDLGRIVLWVPVEVRYGDLDVQGHVNNVTYFTYFEQARVRFLAELRQHARGAGLGDAAGAADADSAGTAEQIGPDDIPFVVVSAEAIYRRPITALAPVSVGIDCAHMTHTSLALRYAVCDQSRGQLYATGTTTITSVDQQSGRPRALPTWARQGVEALLGPAGDAGTAGAPGAPGATRTTGQHA